MTDAEAVEADIDPIDLFEVPEAERLEVDDGEVGEGGDEEELDRHREELRGEVVPLDDSILESAGGFAAWVTPKKCTGPTPGAKALMAYLLDRFPYARSMGIYNCRPPRGKSKGWSEHAEGRAIDLGIPMSSRKVRPELGDPVTALLVQHAKDLGIQFMVFNRRAWSARTPGGRVYKGVNPHYDHVHVGLTPKAGQQLNYATCEAVLGKGGGAVEVPKLEGATHTVDATSLNVRNEPTTSSAKVGSLPNRSKVIVQAGASQQADGYEWVQITAADGVSGWVASKFLDAIPGASPGKAPAGPSSATHAVTAKPNLNLRDQPSTSGAIVAELPTGSGVTVDAGSSQQADGYDWVKVSSPLGDGWVASKFLQAM